MHEAENQDLGAFQKFLKVAQNVEKEEKKRQAKKERQGPFGKNRKPPPVP